MIPTVIKKEDKIYLLYIEINQLKEAHIKPLQLADELNEYPAIEVNSVEMDQAFYTYNSAEENIIGQNVVCYTIKNNTHTELLYPNYILKCVRNIMLNYYKNL